jgi:hypothetical protein
LTCIGLIGDKLIQAKRLTVIRRLPKSQEAFAVGSEDQSMKNAGENPQDDLQV